MEVNSNVRGSIVSIKIDKKIAGDESFLEKISDYFFEYFPHINKFKFSNNFYEKFNHEITLISTIESFRKIFMSEPVEGDVFRYQTRTGGIKYLEIKIVKNDLELGMFSYYVFINDVTKKKLYEEQLQFYAFNDALTGVLNRRLMMKKLNVAVRNSETSKVSGAFIFIDLDDFKKVNDIYGHKYGDKVLIKIANRITSVIPKNIEFGRLGGDEFAILIPNIEEVDLASLCETLCKEVDYVSKNFEKEISVTASIGISLFPDDSSDINRIIDLADYAMYDSKEKGKNVYTFWEELASRITRN